MRVVKILNNNALLAQDESGSEYVFIGNGIGFQNKKDHLFQSIEGQKKYTLTSKKDENSKNNKNTTEAIEQVDPTFIEISGQIISFAEEEFEEVDSKILLPLADHIAFAVERIEKNMEIVNPFAKEIQLMFPKEYSVAVKGGAYIEKEKGIIINEDEISYITLHIHSAISAEHVSLSLQVAELIKNFVIEIGNECNVHIKESSLAYVRFTTHMRYMVARIFRNEHLDLDMNEYTKNNFPYSYERAEELVKKLENIVKSKVEVVEIGYLALHIERIIQFALKQEE